MSVKYEVLKALVRAGGLKKRWNMSTEELLENRRKANAKNRIPELTLTVAFSPSDFVMEGFYQDGKDGMRERPGNGESSVSWRGEGLPYLPYAYRHPEYWLKIKEESRAGGDFIASRTTSITTSRAMTSRSSCWKRCGC